MATNIKELRKKLHIPDVLTDDGSQIQRSTYHDTAIEKPDAFSDRVSGFFGFHIRVSLREQRARQDWRFPGLVATSAELCGFRP